MEGPCADSDHLPQPLYCVRGTVLSKRKKADGTIAIAVTPDCSKVEIGSDSMRFSAADGLILPTSDERAVQLVMDQNSRQAGAIDLNTVALIVTGAVLHAVGRFEPAEALTPCGTKSARPRLQVAEVTLLRVAPVPESVARVVDVARTIVDSSPKSVHLRAYLSSLIQPSAQLNIHSATDQRAADMSLQCLTDLVSGQSNPRQHCRLMNVYNFGSSSRNRPRKAISDTTQFKRPPRSRIRKASHRDLRLIADAEERARVALGVVLTDQIRIDCGLDDEVHEEYDGEEPQHDQSVYCPEVLNLPDGDASLRSSRGDRCRLDYLHGKKEPQVKWMVHRLFETIGANHRPVRVVDVGGGRGDLAVRIARELLNRGMRDSRVTVVDRNAPSLRAGYDFAEKMNVNSIMDFVNDDFDSFSGSFTTEEGYDLYVVALHACGDLTDIALEFARTKNAGFVCVPCCFGKFFNRDWKGGWSSFIPAAVDSGTSLVYDRYELGSLAEKEPRQCSWATMKAINTLRLCSVLEIVPDSCRPSSDQWRLSLEAFSKNYSMRNMVLCGTVRGIIDECSGGTG